MSEVNRRGSETSNVLPYPERIDAEITDTKPATHEVEE